LPSFEVQEPQMAMAEALAAAMAKFRAVIQETEPRSPELL
jgi:hypothetical protein